MYKQFLMSEYLFWVKYLLVASICSLDIFFTIYYGDHMNVLEKNEIGKMLIWYDHDVGRANVSLFVAVKTFCNFMALAIWKRIYLGNKRIGVVVGVALVCFQLWLLWFLLSS